MDFVRADKLTFDPRVQLSRVFVEGFYDWIKYFCRNKEKLSAVFEHVFNTKYFYVAEENGKIASMAACTQGFSPIALRRKEFSRGLGFIRGNFAYYMLKRHMIRNSYPFTLGKNTGSIEFVATSEEFRRQGVCHALLSYIIAQTPYDSYVLEVADTNTNALNLYQKLGFKEIKRTKAPKRSGINFFLYMRKAKFP